MDPLVIPIVGMLIPIIVVPTALYLRHARFARELEHAERIKALELGRTLPQDEPKWTPARISAAIGVGVPLGAFGFAWLASNGPFGYQGPIWIAAGVVGAAGVLCGTFLAVHYFAHYAQAQSIRNEDLAKPVVEPDAFDVVGSRGEPR